MSQMTEICLEWKILSIPCILPEAFWYIRMTLNQLYAKMLGDWYSLVDFCLMTNTYFNFFSGDEGDFGKDCVEIEVDSSGVWSWENEDCRDEIPFICELPRVSTSFWKHWIYLVYHIWHA